MQLLETNIACDVIDQDMYRRNLQLAIKQEEERAKRMLKKQNKQAAQNAVMRIKIMKAELTASRGGGRADGQRHTEPELRDEQGSKASH
eukprot:755095-Hanusia_phi.AAC.4